MDTTYTTGQHHDSHHIYLKQFISLFCSCESFIFQHEQTCRRIFRHANKIYDKNADMDDHAVPPHEYRARGDSKREDMCQQDSQRFTIQDSPLSVAIWCQFTSD